MKKPSWISNLGAGSQLTLIAAIFFLSFATFNILFKATTGDNYFREIIAALIGTILAAVITTMLLRSQTRGEELKDRNVEVFRKKVEVYEQFLDQTLGVMEDGQLSDEEIQRLRRTIYRLSLFSSEETIGIATKFLRAQYVQDCECELSEVISAFRKELALENVDELASWDMEAVETLLRAEDSATFETVRTALGAFKNNLLDAVSAKDPALREGMSADEMFGAGNGVTFHLNTAARVAYAFSMDYSEDEEDRLVVIGHMDATELPAKQRVKLTKLAVALGWSDTDEETPLSDHSPDFFIDSVPDASPGKVVEEQRVWTIGEFADAMLTIERAARVNLAALSLHEGKQ